METKDFLIFILDKMKLLDTKKFKLIFWKNYTNFGRCESRSQVQDLAEKIQTQEVKP